MQPLPTKTYDWQGFSCAYRFAPATATQTPLLFIHPVGVGLSGHFWDRCIAAWQEGDRPLYVPDLLGCGESAMPHVAYYPSEQTVLNGTYQPLSRPIFIYVNSRAAQRLFRIATGRRRKKPPI